MDFLKKSFVFLLAAVLCLGLTACGDTKDDHAAGSNRPAIGVENDDSNVVPVLMGGALPFTNMETLQSENYEDGTYYYEDMADAGMIIVVNTALPRNPMDDTQTLEEYLTGCALELGGAEPDRVQTVEKNDEYTGNMTYPVYIITYTAGGNEDTREWTVFAMDTDCYTYLYGFGTMIDIVDDEMKSIYQDVFAGLYLSAGE